MSIVTFRISDTLKRQMARVRINWSAYVRQAISDALESDEKKSLIRRARSARTRSRIPGGPAARIIRSVREHA